VTAAAHPIRRAVVTGGAGFLGSHLCEALLDRGAEVVCLDNFATGSPRNLTGADVTRRVDVGGDVDLVLHLASAASPPDYLRLPVETLMAGSAGTLNALELAHSKGARFVLASTSEVYGDPLQHPQQESYWGNVNPVGPRSVYDEAKRYAEALTTAYRTARGTDTAIARIFNTYGPRMRPSDGRAVPAFACQALAGEPITVAGDGSQTRSICYVDDTVRGILALADSGVAGPVNIGNPAELTVMDLALLIRDLAGSASPIRHVERPRDDPSRRCPDIGLAASALGWQPRVEPAEGLRRTIAWFAAERGQGVTGGPDAGLQQRGPGRPAEEVDLGAAPRSAHDPAEHLAYLRGVSPPVRAPAGALCPGLDDGPVITEGCHVRIPPAHGSCVLFPGPAILCSVPGYRGPAAAPGPRSGSGGSGRIDRALGCVRPGRPCSRL
jgi:dTDP-glucose 4,6-dehydratase